MQDLHKSFLKFIYKESLSCRMSPEEGKSAILFASEVYENSFGRIDFETTTNIEGGKATNIVAEHCFLNGEIRSHNPSKLEIVKHQIKSIFKKALRSVIKFISKTIMLYKSFSFHQDTTIIRKLLPLWKTSVRPQFKSV